MFREFANISPSFGMARFDGAFWESFEAIRPQNAVPFSRMRSEGFPFNCGGLGAGGVFTRCFGLRPREGPMAGPLGNGAEGGPGGGRGGEGGGGGGGIRVRGLSCFFAKNTSPCTSLQRPCKRKLFSETAAKIKAKLSFLSLFEKNT